MKLAIDLIGGCTEAEHSVVVLFSFGRCLSHPDKDVTIILFRMIGKWREITPWHFIAE